MHVLHVIDGLGLGGAERMLVDIANRTVASGHRVSVCVTRDNVTMARELDRTIELLVLKRRARVSPLGLLRLAHFIRRERVDVMHVHLRSNLAFVLQLRMLHMCATPIVFHDHTSTIELDPTVPAWFRIGRRHIDHYVAVYDRLLAWARTAGIHSSRMTLIPNAIDVSRFIGAPPHDLRTELGIRPEILGVMVASLRREKTVEVMLEALARSSARGRLTVVVVGPDGEPAYAARCKARCRELGLDRDVLFVGGRSDVPNLLGAAELGLLSSQIESGPLALVEYLAAGLPIVSSLVGDIGHRLAEEGVPGFMPPGDVDGFARELDVVVALSPERRRARGELGRKLLFERWNIEVAMPQWYTVYRAAIEVARTPS